MNENLPNGISQIHAKQVPVVSRQFNGLGSTNSSRDPSPSTRFQQIPSSQLPPSRVGALSSQLPPTRPQFDSIGVLTQNYSNLNVSGLNTTNLTPFSSPKVQAFSTSTPVIESKETESKIDNGEITMKESDNKNCDMFVGSAKEVLENKEDGTNRMFTHSATSQFTNVSRNTQLNSNFQSTHENQEHMIKQGENSQRLLNSYFPNSAAITGPTLSARMPIMRPTVQDQSHTTLNSNQNPTIQTSRGVSQQQIPNQNVSSQVQRTNNNPTYIPPSQTFPLQNVPQIQPNQITRPNLPQNRFTPPNTMPRPLGSHSPFHNQPVTTQAYGSIQNPAKANLPPYSQGNSQTIPLMPQQTQAVGSQNFRQPYQSYPNPLQSATGQNQSRAHLHNNRYPTTQQQRIPVVQSEVFQAPTSSLPGSSSTQPVQATPSFPQTLHPPLSTQAFQAPSNQQLFNSPPQQQFGNNQQLQYANTQQTKPLYPGSIQNNPSVTHSGFNRLWGRENHDLLQSPFILPQSKLEPAKISLGQDFLDAVNCSADIFRCTVTKIPESTALMQKSRLPLGVLIHPFKDLNHLPVIQCNTIVRCRACRTYINPFVFFADSKRWKCNLCYRINDLPDEFQFDPVTKTYGDPSRRPEVKSSTIEYIAPAEYMIRPPQPAVYLYLMDISRLAVETGYLYTVCNTLNSELPNLPGDARTQIGFLAYDSALHFYSLSEGQNQPHEMTVLDVDDVFLPCPDNLLVNLQDRMEMISDLLTQLPTRYNNTYETNSALGAALQVAYKMMSSTGGRITVFQVSLPNAGPGALTPREDPNQRSSSEVPHLNPANDFYKRLALECSGQQIAVDLFVLNSQFADLSTISGISRFSGGCMHHFPLFKASRTLQNEAFERSFRRYITRKIGFEAVMRIRCTRGLSIHTFHGNFFVRSTDLLSLPNINPDAGFGMQVSIEENLTDVQTVCFQAALLYTSSKGERRIRVHTLCLPVANNLSDVINSADQQCIVGLLSKMAVDRSMQSSLSDAREAFLNVAIDILTSYKMSLNMASSMSGLMAPDCLKLLPLYISALLKNIAFRIGTSTRLDDRVKAMCDMKTKPLPYLMQMIYPDLYPIHNLEEHNVVVNEEDEIVHQPPHLQLTARSLDSHGAYLMDTGEHMMLFVCSNVAIQFLNNVLGVADIGAISDDLYELPLLENQQNKRLHSFVNYLNDDKPFPATLQVFSENSSNKIAFYERLIEDRLENSLSYHEFLQHIKTQVK